MALLLFLSISECLRLVGVLKLLSQDTPTLVFTVNCRMCKKVEAICPQKQSSEGRAMPVGSIFFCVKNRYFFQLNLDPSDLELNQESEHERSKK